MNAIAEGYVKLVLAVGQHDAAYVDAYYGPDAWKTDAEREKKPLAQIDSEAERLIRDAGPRPSGTATSWSCSRHDYLVKQLQALRARVRMLSGAKMSFDEESAALYDAVAPNHPESYFQAALNDLDRRLPGKGSLVERYDAYRQAFIIPKDRLSKVFDTAIAEGRRRTQQHIPLPPGESFKVEYVTNKSWSGYNWYQGNYPQPDPGEHGPADLHRSRGGSRVPRRLSRTSRLQRAPGEVARPRPRMGRDDGVSALLAAVAGC